MGEGWVRRDFLRPAQALVFSTLAVDGVGRVASPSSLGDFGSVTKWGQYFLRFANFWATDRINNKSPCFMLLKSWRNLASNRACLPLRPHALSLLSLFFGILGGSGGFSPS